MSPDVEDSPLFLEVGVADVTRRRTVTESDVVGFAGLSGDFHPLHTDEIFATEGPFHRRIAHGFLVLSIASGLLTVGPRAPLNDEVKAFYGLDRVRFVKPTFFGDSIQVKWNVVEREAKGADRFVANVACEVLNQDGEVVAVFQMLLLIGK